MARPILRLSQRIETTPGVVACPDCGHRLPFVKKKEAWVEFPADPGWTVAYRLVMRRGRPVVAETRVFPDAPGRKVPGTWDEDPNSVPAEGVPGSVLRSLRVSDATTWFRKFVRRWYEEFGEEATERIFGRHGFRPSTLRVAQRPGRAGRPDGFYARWAEAYVERVAAGSQTPVRDLAERPPVRIAGFRPSNVDRSLSAVRGIIQEARRRELLTAAPPGRAGGELTQAAVLLLATSNK